MNSHELFERAKKVSPGGVHSPVRSFRSVGGEPLFFKSAEGAYLTSVEGRRYIDFCQSFGPNILGHRDPDVEKVVRTAISEAWTFGACEPYSLELAEWITSRLSFVESIRFVCSGTEAVMSALRIARAATGRDLILKFDGCYHGHADSLLVRAGSGLAGESASDSAGVSTRISEGTLVCPLDDESAFSKAMERNGKQVAAVILEPLPANFGLLPQKKEWIEHVAKVARAHGALVIFDEVISGFRVALGGMAGQLGMKPDLVTYGKVIGGGFPIGAYAGRRDLMELVAPVGPVYQAGTLAANPVGTRAGLATLKKLEMHHVYGELEQRTQQFVEQLTRGFHDTDAPVRVARAGSIFWLHLSPEISHEGSEQGAVIRRPDQISRGTREWYSGFFQRCLDGGVYLAPSPYEVGFVSLAHTPEILRSAAETMVAAATDAAKKTK